MSLFPLSSMSVATPSSPAQSAFDKLVDDYFDFYFQFHPTAGTQAGLHQYDEKLEDFSRSAVDAEIAGAIKFQKLFNSIASRELSQESAGDLEVLTSSIQGRLQELQTIQMWRKDPNVYIDDPSSAIFLLMSRNFAPAADRLRSVISLERDIPRVLEEARQNVSNPPGSTRKWPCSRCRIPSNSFSMMFRKPSAKCRTEACWPNSKRATLPPSQL